MAGRVKKEKAGGVGARICFRGNLLKAKGEEWLFVKLPEEASEKLPSRGMNTVKGMMNGTEFVETLRPDGAGGHWMKVEREFVEKAFAKRGDEVEMEISPVEEEPEPRIPDDFKKALTGADMKARGTWSEITAMARRDWIQWIESAKRDETRMKRIVSGCDMLAKGKRRPCCFDRSGMYSKSLSCPEAEE